MNEYVNGNTLVEELQKRWKDIFGRVKKPYSDDDYYLLGRERGLSDAIYAIRIAQNYNEFTNPKEKRRKGRVTRNANDK